jgi:SAM-dependent methyltransferase
VDEPLRRNASFIPAPGTDLEKSWTEQFPDRLDAYAEDAWGCLHQDSSEVIEWQYEAIRRLLGDRLDQDGFTIVELGAARGALLAELARRHPSLRLVAVEPSPVMARHAQASGARVINAVIDDCDITPATVDAVVSFGAFIQIRDPMSALQHVHAVLKPGGLLLLDSPNDRSLTRALARIAWRCRSVFEAAGASALLEHLLWRVYSPGRFYYYSNTTFRRMLGSAGFSVLAVRYRPARSVRRLRMAWYARLLARALSRVELIVGRGAWVEVSARKR